MDTLQRGKYGTTKAEALRAYQDGAPSLLPNSNQWKWRVEDHRWGQHGTTPDAYCPACEEKNYV